MGLTVRHIQTTTVQEKDATGAVRSRVVPVLDDGREVELYAVDVPQSVEAEGGAAIDAYVAAHLAAIATNDANDITAADAAPTGGQD